jgi:TolB-like protein
MGDDTAAEKAAPPATVPTAAPVPAPTGDPTAGFWGRVHEHKIIQWGIGYLGAALALAHGQELVGHAFHWPDVVTRIFMIVLIVGFPISLTLAWYHGHRGLKQMSAGELAIVSVLLLIGAVFFTAALPSDEHAADAVAHDAPSSASDVHADGAAADGAVAESSSPSSTTERRVLPNSVAVLPLENLSADRDSSSYALGMHAEIISQLTKLSNVSVIGRDSVLQYGVNRPPPERIAAELNVESLLVGTFQAVNGQIRIAMQLVDPATRANLWSDEYQSDFEDVFAVQADISMNVANALSVEFSAAEQQEIEKKPTSSAEAYALFLQAEGILDAAGGFDVAHGLLDRAIELDPTFARAIGTKAAFYSATFINTVNGAAVSASSQADLDRLVRSHAERALALDPTEVRAHSALRTLNILTWRWSTFERSLEPGDAIRFSAPEVWVLAWMGRRAEARRIAQQLYDLNPGNGLHTMIQYVAQSYAGDRAGSMQTLRRALEAQPANPLLRLWLGFNYIVLGNDTEALAELQSVERQLGANAPIVYLPELAYAYSRLGRPPDAQRVFEQFRVRAEQSDPGAGAWATAYWAIGDKTQALRWLGVLAQKARNHEIDPALVSAMNLKMNFLDDPALNTPELQSALSLIAGD